MEFYYGAVLLLCFVLGSQAAWPIEQSFPIVVKKIYRYYPTCARELNRQVFEYLADGSSTIQLEKARGLYDKAQSAGLDVGEEADFLNDLDKLSMKTGALTKLGLWSVMKSQAVSTDPEDVTTFQHALSTALHVIVDADKDNTVNETEILEYAKDLASMAVLPITAKHYIGCVGHLAPGHMHMMMDNLWEKHVLKKFDTGYPFQWQKDNPDIGDGKLNFREMKRLFVLSGSMLEAQVQKHPYKSYEELFAEFDKNNDTYVDADEFKSNMLDHVQNPDKPDIGIIFNGFLTLYDCNKNRLIDELESGFFIRDVKYDPEGEP